MKHHKHTFRHASQPSFFSKSRGIALIEAIVALVIVSIGALAGTRLHMTIVGSHSESMARSQAVFVIQQISESLRGAPDHAAFVSRCTDYSAYRTSSGFTLPPAVLTATVSADNCNNPVPNVTISTTWQSPLSGQTQTLSHTQPLAWINPNRYGSTNAGSGSGYISPSPQARRLTDTVGIAASTVTAANSGFTSIIGGFAVRVEDGKHILYKRSGNTYFKSIESLGEYVMIAGIFAVHSSAPNEGSGNNQWLRSQVRMVTSNVGECNSPLTYTSANDPTTYQQGTVGNGVPFGYLCFVPEGWYGNLAVAYSTNSDKDGPFQGKPFKACPRISAASTDGIRLHRVLTVDINGIAVGQSGVLTRHQFVSGSPTRPLNRLDFIIHNQTNCPTSVGTLITSIGAEGAALSNACRTDVACLKPYDYIVETINAVEDIQGNLTPASGVTVNLGTLTLAADSSCPTGAGCGCTVTAGSPVSYKCVVRNGWAGNITVGGTAHKTCSPNNTFTAVMATTQRDLTVYATAATCP